MARPSPVAPTMRINAIAHQRGVMGMTRDVKQESLRRTTPNKTAPKSANRKSLAKTKRTARITSDATIATVVRLMLNGLRVGFAFMRLLERHFR
jgi:hypothetical protein